MLLAEIGFQMELPIIGPKGMAAIKRADAASQRVPDPSFRARVDFWRSVVASQSDHWKEALDLADLAITAFENANQPRAAIRAVLQMIEFRFTHSSVDDYRAVTSTIAKWLPIAKSIHGRAADLEHVAQLELDAAFVRYWTGDVAGGHADLVRLWQAGRHLKSKVVDEKVTMIEGDVVDQRGRPVAGATVAAASMLIMDSIGYLPNVRYNTGDAGLAIATSDANGHFVLPDCAERGAIVAQLGDRRSVGVNIANHLTLVLAPTRLISGKVALGGLDHTQVAVMIRRPGSSLDQLVQMVPVAADGSFTADGTSQGPVLAGVAMTASLAGHIASTSVPGSSEPVTNLVLDPGVTTRSLDVIARSTLSVPLENVQFLLLAGRLQFTSVAELDAETRPGVSSVFGHHVAGEALPHSLTAKFKSGDLIGQFKDVPAGDITVCAIAFNGDLQDRAVIAMLRAHIKEFELRCETVDGAATTAVITTPPQKSFD